MGGGGGCCSVKRKMCAGLVYVMVMHGALLALAKTFKGDIGQRCITIPCDRYRISSSFSVDFRSNVLIFLIYIYIF